MNLNSNELKKHESFSVYISLGIGRIAAETLFFQNWFYTLFSNHFMVLAIYIVLQMLHISKTLLSKLVTLAKSVYKGDYVHLFVAFNIVHVDITHLTGHLKRGCKQKCLQDVIANK